MFLSLQAGGGGYLDTEADLEEEDDGAQGVNAFGASQRLLGSDGRLVTVSAGQTSIKSAPPPPETHTHLYTSFCHWPSTTISPHAIHSPTTPRL